MTQEKQKSSRLLIVEGNIGAGKSTFLRLIKDRLACQIVYEPHEKWQNIADKGNLLEKFYTDTPRWAYTFQSYAFITRTLAQKNHDLKNPYPIQILERSVFSDRYCFAKNLYESGTMSDLEWTLYLEWFGWFCQDHVKKPDGFIYLKTTPQTCYKRLLKRARHEEKAVPIDYLEQLHNKHENWLIKKEKLDDYVKGVPVLVLDCDKEFETDEAHKNKLINQITDFFNISYFHPSKQIDKSPQIKL